MSCYKKLNVAAPVDGAASIGLTNNTLLTEQTKWNLIDVKVDSVRATSLDTGAPFSVMTIDFPHKIKKVLKPAIIKLVEVVDGRTASVIGM